MGFVAGGLLVEAGCAWLWVESARLTSIYNADYTREFFQMAPWLARFSDQAAPPAEASALVAPLIAGLLAMTAGDLAAIPVARAAAAWQVVGFAALFRLTLVALPGLFSTDVFSYVMYGRIAAVEGQNPYVSPPGAFPNDPFLGWVFPFWRDQPSVYGPLWTDLSALLASLSAGWTPFQQVLVYRGALVGLEAAGLAALWWTLGRVGCTDRKRAWLVYAWNPLVLFDLVGATHNDVAMLTLMLLGVGVIASAASPPLSFSPSDRAEPSFSARAGRRASNWRWMVGLVAIALGALVKYAAAVVVLPLVVSWSAAARTSRARGARLMLGLGVPLLLAGVLWWPWLATTDAVEILGQAAGGRLVLNSTPDLLALSLADHVLVAQGMPREVADAMARTWVRWLARAAFAGYAGWELWRLWRTPRGASCRDRTVAALGVSARLLLALPLLVLTWVWSWYFSWALVVAVLLGPGGALTRVVVAYTLVALPIVYAHQYLNEQLPGIWVVVMALGPLVVLAPIRRRPALVNS